MNCYLNSLWINKQLKWKVTLFRTENFWVYYDIYVRKKDLFENNDPDSQTWKDRFWAESVINFRCQEDNKFHIESVISDDIVDKLLLEIWQNLLIFYASGLAIEIKQNFLSQFDGRQRSHSVDKTCSHNKTTNWRQKSSRHWFYKYLNCDVIALKKSSKTTFSYFIYF